MARDGSRGLGRAALGVAAAPLLALAAALGVLLLDGETGLRPLAGLRDEVAELRDEVAELGQERARLTQRIRALRRQPLAIEAAAREQLGMLRPGEIVVRWPEGSDLLD